MYQLQVGRYHYSIREGQFDLLVLDYHSEVKNHVVQESKI